MSSQMSLTFNSNAVPCWFVWHGYFMSWGAYPMPGNCLPERDTGIILFSGESLVSHSRTTSVYTHRSANVAWPIRNMANSSLVKISSHDLSDMIPPETTQPRQRLPFDQDVYTIPREKRRINNPCTFIFAGTGQEENTLYLSFSPPFPV